MSDLAKNLEREAYEKLREAKQYPPGSSLRMLKENHGRELFQEVKRLRTNKKLLDGGHR